MNPQSRSKLFMNLINGRAPLANDKNIIPNNSRIGLKNALTVKYIRELKENMEQLDPTIIGLYC